jgi:hypothetical protein
LGVFSFWGFFFVPFLPPISAVFSIILGVRSIGLYAKEKRPWSLLAAFIGATLGCMGIILAIDTYIKVYTY